MLVHTTDHDEGIRRKGAGTGFYYVDPDGKKVTDEKVIERIKRLAIPPAYTDVWICPRPNGHLQATGRDARKRKQYRYHEEWHELQKLRKFDRLPQVGAGLPTLRRKVRSDLHGEAGDKAFAVATAVKLIDKLGFRVGNETYLVQNGSRGIATLDTDNVEISESGNEVEIEFTAKGGREVITTFSDPLLHEALAQCHELPGQRLFNYQGRNGDSIAIGSGDVNDYLREVYQDEVTTKDLRTWRASTAAVQFLRRISTPDDREDELREAIRFAAETIENKYETCREHYIHPTILDRYRDSGKWGISRLKPEKIPELQLPESLLLKILS